MPSTRRNPRYIAILGISAITILVAGAIFRPRTPGPDETAAAGASTDITRLQRLTQRRSIDGFAEFFTELARQVDDRVLRLEEGGRTAIVWGPAEAVTAGGSPRLPDEDQARGADESSDAWTTKTKTAGPHLPAAVLDLAAIEQDRRAFAVSFFDKFDNFLSAAVRHHGTEFGGLIQTVSQLHTCRSFD